MAADCQSTIEFAQIAVRGLLLALVCVGGMVSIYFGWRLYHSAVLSKVDGEIAGRSIKFKLSAASPGVFLAAFGAYLLFAVSQHRWVEKEVQEPVARPTVATAAVAAEFELIQHRPESCSCPQKQECLLAKKTVEKSWIGGESEISAASLKEDLAAIRVMLQRITPLDQAERVLHVKAVQAIARLEVAAAAASVDGK